MADWRSELRGNRRLQAGLLLSALLVWAYALLSLADLQQALQKDRLRLVREQRQLLQAAEARQWPALGDEAVTLLGEYRQRAWREESEGRLQAVFQDWLNQKLAELETRPLEMAVSVDTATPVDAASADAPAADAADTAPALPPEMRVARARLRLNADILTLADLLLTVESDPRWLWVDQLSWRAGTPASVELRINALFLLAPRLDTE